MYNSNEYIGKKYGALIAISNPFSKKCQDSDFRKHLRLYCTVCDGGIRESTLSTLKRRSVVACSSRCTKIHLASLDVNYWEDNEISIDKAVNHSLLMNSKGRKKFIDNITEKHKQQICDLYESECVLSGAKLYLGKTTSDRYRTASLDRINNLLGYEHIENNRWVHKTVNEMLNCMDDNRLNIFSEMIVNRQK